MIWGSYKTENTFCLSGDIRFKKLYNNGAFALSENNKLYLIGYNANVGYKAVSDTLYKLENIASPVKIAKDGNGLKHRSYLIVDEKGNCWGIAPGSYVPFLTSFCQKEVKMLFENKELTLTQKIQSKNGRTMYPFRENILKSYSGTMWASSPTAL